MRMSKCQSEVPYLVRKSSDGKELVASPVFLLNKSKLKIGGLKSDIKLSGDLISKFNAVITLAESENWKIQDKGKDCLFLNGKKLIKNVSTIIQHDDVISFGPNPAKDLAFVIKKSVVPTIVLKKLDDKEKVAAQCNQSQESDVFHKTKRPHLDDAHLEDMVGSCDGQAKRKQDVNEISKLKLVNRDLRKQLKTLKTENETLNDILDVHISFREDVKIYTDCSICFETLIKAVTLVCGHSFCEYCISKWRQTNYVCPLCRNFLIFATQSLSMDNICVEYTSTLPIDVQSKRQETIGEREAAAKTLGSVMTFRAEGMRPVDDDARAALRRRGRLACKRFIVGKRA